MVGEEGDGREGWIRAATRGAFGQGALVWVTGCKGWPGQQQQDVWCALECVGSALLAQDWEYVVSYKCNQMLP